MFLRATLKDGGQVVSEFSQLAKVQRYANDVYAGRSPFNAWKVVGTTHPITGEKVLIRQQKLYNGNEVVSLERVTPTIENHEMDPANFSPVTVLQVGRTNGRRNELYTVPAEVPEALAAIGAVEGTQFIKHRDTFNMRYYVITAVAQPAEGEGAEEAPEQRWYLDGQPQDYVNSLSGIGGGLLGVSPDASLDQDDDDDYEDDDRDGVNDPF